MRSTYNKKSLFLLLLFLSTHVSYSSERSPEKSIENSATNSSDRKSAFARYATALVLSTVSLGYLGHVKKQPLCLIPATLLACAGALCFSLDNYNRLLGRRNDELDQCEEKFNAIKTLVPASTRKDSPIKSTRWSFHTSSTANKLPSLYIEKKEFCQLYEGAKNNIQRKFEIQYHHKINGLDFFLSLYKKRYFQYPIFIHILKFLKRGQWFDRTLQYKFHTNNYYYYPYILCALQADIHDLEKIEKTNRPSMPIELSAWYNFYKPHTLKKSDGSEVAIKSVHESVLARKERYDKALVKTDYDMFREDIFYYNQEEKRRVDKSGKPCLVILYDVPEEILYYIYSFVRPKKVDLNNRIIDNPSKRLVSYQKAFSFINNNKAHIAREIASINYEGFEFLAKNNHFLKDKNNQPEKFIGNHEKIALSDTVKHLLIDLDFHNQLGSLVRTSISPTNKLYYLIEDAVKMRYNIFSSTEYYRTNYDIFSCQLDKDGYGIIDLTEEISPILAYMYNDYHVCLPKHLVTELEKRKIETMNIRCTNCYEF